MQEEGYLQFHLHKEKECTIGFLGDRGYNCTAAIVCHNVIIPCPEGEPKKCEKGYLEISDGLGGDIVGCGKFDLAIPRISTKGGRDLYLTFLGVWQNAICQVYCNEDTRFYEHLKDKKAKKLIPSKKNRRLYDSCVCGIKNQQDGRIVGGDDAIPFEYPWMVGITFSDLLNAKTEQEFSNRSSFCGATLISDRHALTAAHCFVNSGMQPQDVNLLLHAHVLDLMTNKKGNMTDEDLIKETEKIPGWNQEKQTDAQEQSIRVNLKTIMVHPLYDKMSFDYDVAILYLDKRINFKGTKKVRPICLQPQGKFMSYEEGQIFEVAGWGLIDEKGVGETSAET